MLSRFIHVEACISTSFLLFLNDFIYLFLAVLSLWYYMGFALAVASSVYALVVVPRLPIAVASLAAEHRLAGAWASVFAAYGIFPDQGSNLCLLHVQADSFPLGHQSPVLHF